MATNRTCYLCKNSVCFQEADRVGLRCRVDGTEVHPAHKNALSLVYQAELDMRVEQRAGRCDDFVADV